MNASECKAPFGIILITFLSLLAAAIGIYMGVQMINQLSMPYNGIRIGAIHLLFLAIMGLSLIFLGLFWVISIFGLISIQPWAWKLSKWSYLLSVPLFILATIAIIPFDFEMFGDNRIQGLFVLVSIAIFFYLQSHPIKRIYLKVDN